VDAPPHRGTSFSWVPSTAIELGAGLAISPRSSPRTDITSLAVMVAVSGLAVGFTQGATLGSMKRTIA